MELEELKQSWLKIEKGITELSGQTLKTTHIISAIRKTDAKTRLLNRFRIGYAITAICIIIMALSPLWSPGYMPKWWATTFSILATCCIALTLYLCHRIKSLDFNTMANYDTLKTVVHIKRIHSIAELTVLLIIPIMLASIDYRNTSEKVLIWSLFTAGAISELLTFAKFSTDYKEIIKWSDPEDGIRSHKTRYK